VRQSRVQGLSQEGQVPGVVRPVAVRGIACSRGFRRWQKGGFHKDQAATPAEAVPPFPHIRENLKGPRIPA
jgi:hypothetical protein